MDEEWRDIPGFEGYQVSNLGQVRSRKKKNGMTDKWHLMKPWPNAAGYLQLNLTIHGKHHPFLVHRLVLMAFIGPCPEGYVTRHLDSTPANNRLDNLEWSTQGDNLKDKELHGTMNWGEHHPLHKLTRAQVDEIRQRYKRWAHDKSNAKELARIYGISQNSIIRIVSFSGWKRSYK